ncbi:MAG: Ku protein [Deltaproteobacteria bacterium]|nr:Ku protein [Deltaproteobacteria bacterium]
MARSATKRKKKNGRETKSRPSRPIWKGSINFGLVTIPVALFSAETSDDLDFDLLDKRDFSPVRYRRVNQNTGQEVPWSEIVKGYKYEDGEYVVLTEEDFIHANVEATQSIDIMNFVDAAEISPIYFDKPYYLEPLKNGRRAYALLRHVMAKTNKVGIAKIVIRTRQHLAALMPQGPVLVVSILRFAHELRDAGALEVPEEDLEVSDKETKMAERLVETMVEKWKPEQYRDNYRESLLQLIEKKVKAGKTKVIEERKREEPRRAGKVINIMDLLKRSVEQAQQKEEPQRRRKAG